MCIRDSVQIALSLRAASPSLPGEHVSPQRIGEMEMCIRDRRLAVRERRGDVSVIEVSRIQSHSEPRRFLKQHVAEIIAASDAILVQHGPAPWRALGGDALTTDLARLHDLGKGSASFQAYICLLYTSRCV